MTVPSKREIDAVSQVEQLDAKTLDALNDILCALGYENEHVALMLESDPAETESMRIGAAPFPGADLVKICLAIRLRPGVCQMRNHFDANESSVKSGEKWKGPHPLLTTGEKVPGEAVQRVVPLLSENTFGLSNQKLKAIASGTVPVRLHALRAIVVAGLEQKMLENRRARGFRFLVPIYESIPSGVLTVEDWLAERTRVKITEPADKPPTQPQGADMNDQATSVPSASPVVWNDDEKTVQIGLAEYSLSPGTDMSNIAARVRALIDAHPDKLQVNAVLQACGMQVSPRSKVMASIQNGNLAFEVGVIKQLATYFKIPVAALFTGVGLGIIDPVTGATATSPAKTDGVDPEYFKGQLLDRTVRLAPGIDMREIVTLHIDDRSGVALNWVSLWLRLHEDGASFKKVIDGVRDSLKDCSPQLKNLAVQMILESDGEKSDEESDT